MQFRIQRRPIQLQETKDGDAQVTEVKTKLIEKRGMPKTAYPNIALECTFLNVSFKLSITQQRCCR